MDRPASPLHDAGNHRTVERRSPRQAARRGGSLTIPASPLLVARSPGTRRGGRTARHEPRLFGAWVVIGEPEALRLHCRCPRCLKERYWKPV
jgi:hypothetical protein